ncbi:MAG: hypothetical protein HY301_17890 [Verrucomicrobia bacterium]|nr:hypothetical protein [Verrucomicrobiota bacterium]
MTPQRILPDLQCSLICDGFRQEANGNLILLGVMDRVMARDFPVTVPQMVVVNRWTAGKGAFNQTIKFFGTDQTTLLAKAEGRVELPDVVVSATTIMGIGNFKLETPGPYWMEVILDDVLKLRYALPVFQVTQQPPPGDAPQGAPPQPPV